MNDKFKGGEDFVGSVNNESCPPYKMDEEKGFLNLIKLIIAKGLFLLNISIILLALLKIVGIQENSLMISNLSERKISPLFNLPLWGYITILVIIGLIVIKKEFTIKDNNKLLIANLLTFLILGATGIIFIANSSYSKIFFNL